MKEPEAAADGNESRDWYRSLFELSMDAMCIVAPDGTVIDVNQAWLDLFGYTRNDLTTLNVRELYLDPSDRDEFIRRMDMEGRVDDEIHYRKKDGTVFLCRRSQVARKDESGRVIAYQGVLHDITNESATEEALRQSEERYRLLAENASDVIWVYSLPERRYTYVSPAAARLHGCTLEEARNAAVSDHLPPESLAIVERMMRAIERSDGSQPEQFTFEAEQLKKDGSRFWTEVSISVVRDEQESSPRVVGITRDITARKKAEEALRRSEERYRLLAENASDVIWVYSLPERRYTYVSPATEQMFGYTTEEAAQLAPADHMPAESLEHIRRIMTEMEQSPERSQSRATLECEQLRRDGRPIWTEISYSLVRDESGKAHSIVGITRDITARKRAEQKLEQVNDELRRLAARLHAAREEERARVSVELHDKVGQTLSVVKMDLDMLRRRFQEESVHDAFSLVDHVDSLLSGCVATLRGVETDLRPAMLEDLGLAATIEWQMSEFENHTGINCTISRLDDVALPDMISALAVFRTFQEALNNVVEHSGADAVDVSLYQDNAQLTILLHDNGRSTSEESMHSQESADILDMREQLRPFGGSVEIVGVPFKGTTVSISIPMTKK